MNTIIREKRKLTFKFKRITPKIIREFSNIIENEVNFLIIENDTELYKMYSIDAIDNTSFESQSSEIFNENQIIENRIIKKVLMRFYTLDNSKSIEIQLVHLAKDENFENFLTVSGDDPTWVNGTLVRLTEILNMAEKQSKNQYSGWLICGLVVLFNVEYFRLFLPHIQTTNEIVSCITICGPFIASLFMATKFNEYISDVWPEIELQTGPGHQRLPSKRRKKIQWLTVTIILPLILSAIYDIIKSTF